MDFELPYNYPKDLTYLIQVASLDEYSFKEYNQRQAYWIEICNGAQFKHFEIGKSRNKKDTVLLGIWPFDKGLFDDEIKLRLATEIANFYVLGKGFSLKRNVQLGLCPLIFDHKTVDILVIFIDNVYSDNELIESHPSEYYDFLSSF